MNRIQEILHDQPSPSVYADRYLRYLRELLERISRDEIAVFIQTLINARAKAKRIYFIGNGGSAATASHFANDLAFGTRSWTRPFRVISLTDNVSLISAIGNDHGYEEIFVAQLKVLMEEGDVVVAISASGNSANIVSAIRWANDHGAITVGLTGFDGGQLKQMADVSVHVPTQKAEYGPVEDLHMVFDHLVGTYLRGMCDAEQDTADTTS